MMYLGDVDSYFDQILDDSSSTDTPIDDTSNDILDFKDTKIFQRELIFNKLLPYANELDDEADALLEKIKANLGRCVILKQIKPGCIFWSTMLHKYITLYDLRFTKEDHITFIKLMYELITIPNLESFSIGTFGYCLYMLIRKNDLISPNELELPWRPLYDLYYRVTPQKVSQVSFYHYPSSVGTLLESIVTAAKVYFPVSATQEILDELRPQVCPFDVFMMQITMKNFVLFLPVQLAPEYYSLGHELWLHEFMKLWEVCNCNAQTWGNSIMHLISKLAYNNIGYIDWEPYIPLMFTRFVQSFNLPVCYKKMRCNSNCKIKPNHIGLWIASVLGNKSSAQNYLEKFLKTIETYFHPANYGPWLKSLGKLFVNISYFVMMRIYTERYQANKLKKTWKTPIPESHKLTDADIDAFVSSMVPISLIGIFNKRCFKIFYDGLQHLALMRPNLVIPNVLEKIYPPDGSEIEPHKLITAMLCMITISRPLIQGSHIPNKEYAFQEGPIYVMSLLNASLSGIDPNDPNKCSVTFCLIATYVTMIPLVDCSKSTIEMTENERLICEQTSLFEDFVLQFMDKVFIWIESNSVESVRLENQTNDNGKSQCEAMAEIALSRVFSTLLKQMSHPIFMSALSKLRTFILEHVLETQVAGKLVAVLCKCFCVINSYETMKALFPFLSEKVLDAIGEDDEVIKTENLDNQLLYPLLLLNMLVQTQGDALLPYVDTLFKLLDKVIRLESRQGNLLGCFTLSSILQSLSSIAFINVDRDLNNPEYPYFKDWGKTINIRSTKIITYTPGETELEIIKKIFTRYFIPAVESIQNFIKTENSLSRNELQVTLRIIFSVLDGCDAVLPFWDEPPLEIKPYDTCIESFQPIVGYSAEVKMPDGSNVRQFLVQTMLALQEIMLKNVEDDTKSLIILELIWQNLFLGRLRIPVDSSFKFTTSYSVSKKIMENKMTGNNGWFPVLVLSRVHSQHQMRKMCATSVFTETHKIILMNLLKLSTSKYSIIRIRSQKTIQIALGYFPNAYIILIPYILEILEQGPVVNHDAFKGILYLLPKKINLQESLLVKQDWNFIKLLWPAIVLSQPSEKLSVIHLKDNIVTTVIDTFYTTNIKTEIPATCTSVAENFWNSKIKLSIPPPTDEEIQEGIINAEKLAENNLKAYNDTLDTLLNALLEKNLHWRHRLMAMNFISVLILPEQIFPSTVVRFFLNALINESLEERKVALRVMMYIFKQLKKKHSKVKIEIPSTDNKILTVNPGTRPDNAWLQYNYNSRPKNAPEWDEPRYVHKSYIGYYAWPRELHVYAPLSELSYLSKDNVSDHEREVEKFFSDQQNIDKLVKYLSLEGKKGSDKFSNSRLLTFKGLFRNHGDAFLANFLPHLKNLVNDKQESAQRCAAEIICGLIKGSKHWPYEMTEAMWNSILPIMRTALSNLTVETITDWTICIANASKDRDPNKLHWLLECLMEESPLGQSEASFVECGRLQILQNALSFQSWKVRELMQRLLLRFENRLEASPFQNVRERLACTLALIFYVNMKFDTMVTSDTSFPEVNDFIEKLYPRLQSLIQDEDPSTLLTSCVANVSIDSNTGESSQLPQSSSNTIDIQREKNIRLLKIICKWIMETVMSANVDSLSSFYKIYPIICQLENNEKDEELSKTCSRTLAVLAQILTPPKHMPTVLEAVRNISESSSWSAKANCLEFLQVLVFHNMSILLSNEEWIFAIQSIVLKLLEDECLEVRDKAAQVLGGLLHCTIIPNQETLLEEFKKKAKTKLGNRKKKLSNDEEELAKNAKIINAIRLRHSGVLGMCAFIQAYPYDIPKHVPPIFEYLNCHLNDPEPIPSTIRKTLNEFKRTHCDGWNGLQGLAENLTEEQFAILQDLIVPPSYYA